MMSVIDDVINETVDEFMQFDESAGETVKKKEAEKSKPKFVETESSTHTVKHSYKTKKYSELIGWDEDVLKNKKDFDCVYFEDSDWDENDIPSIPDIEKFKHHIVDHRAMYPLVLSMQPQFNGFTPLAVGPTGCGKSVGMEFYCATVRQPFLRINGRQDMESDTIIGKPWLRPDGGMDYLIGDWPKATANGWFVLIDEPWKIPPGIWMTAQRALEKGGIWQLDDMPGDSVLDKQIVPKNTYRCVLADNVVGTGDDVDKYGATMIQDGSTLNRLDIVIKWDYLPQKLEEQLLKEQFPEIADHMAKKMVSLLNLLRTGYDGGELSAAASIRNIEAWAKYAIEMQDYEAAFTWVLLNRYAEESERAAVENHYFTVLGERLS